VPAGDERGSEKGPEDGREKKWDAFCCIVRKPLKKQKCRFEEKFIIETVCTAIAHI
jgi:hypothetical protein